MQPWKSALVAKPFGRNVNDAPFVKRVADIWKPHNEMEIIPLSFGYYLIKFDDDEDRERVLLVGP